MGLQEIVTEMRETDASALCPDFGRGGQLSATDPHRGIGTVQMAARLSAALRRRKHVCYLELGREMAMKIGGEY